MRADVRSAAVAKDYFDCAWDYGRRIDFLVDIYRGARKALVLGMISLVVVTFVNALRAEGPVQAEDRMINRLRTDSELIQSLRDAIGENDASTAVRLAPETDHRSASSTETTPRRYSPTSRLVSSSRVKE